MRSGLICLLALMLSAAPALADRLCADQPPRVRAYLQAHPEWSIVRYSDLGSDQEWKDPEVCPGLVVVDLEANHHPYYALALLRHQNGNDFERTMLLSPEGVSPSERVFGKDQKILPEPDRVLWVVVYGAPGIYWNYAEDVHGRSGRVHMPRPVFHLTDLEKVDSVSYIAHGKLLDFEATG
jgi:hypothetical protein